MKVPPKRKGNWGPNMGFGLPVLRLNESPSEKEGKYNALTREKATFYASMKVPPKRKGNRDN